MMGVSSMTYWASWFVTFAFLFTLSSAFLTGAVCIDFGANGRMLTRSSPSLIFCSLTLYSLALVSFIFALSTLFTSRESLFSFVPISSLRPPTSVFFSPFITFTYVTN